jgi:hypothetical protein
MTFHGKVRLTEEKPASIDCAGNHDVMAKQVRPGSENSVVCHALRARKVNEKPICAFHQGRRRVLKSPDVWLQSFNLSTITE